VRGGVTFAPTIEELVESIMESREATRTSSAAEAKRARTLEAAKIAARIIAEEDEDEQDEDGDGDLLPAPKKSKIVKRKRASEEEAEEQEEEEEEEEIPRPRKQVKRAAKVPEPTEDHPEEDEEEEETTPPPPRKQPPPKVVKKTPAVAKKGLSFIERVQAHQAAGSGMREAYQAPEHQYLQHNYPTFYRNAFRQRR
jgi:hypothetical protein